MKRLCLIRHAKSSWLHPTMEDHERPLDEKGEHDAVELGQALKEKGIVPDHFMTSTAVRTRDTAELIAKELNFPINKITSEDHLYNAGVEDLLMLIQDLSPAYKTVVLVGHNPGLTWLANYLAEAHVPSLPTCGAFCMEFATNDWQDITTAEGKTLFIETPKHLHE